VAPAVFFVPKDNKKYKILKPQILSGVVMAHDHKIRPYIRKKLFLEFSITAFTT
jgi:hypothetical protein